MQVKLGTDFYCTAQSSTGLMMGECAHIIQMCRLGPESEKCSFPWSSIYNTNFTSQSSLGALNKGTALCQTGGGRCGDKLQSSGSSGSSRTNGGDRKSIRVIKTNTCHVASAHFGTEKVTPLPSCRSNIKVQRFGESGVTHEEEPRGPNILEAGISS